MPCRKIIPLFCQSCPISRFLSPRLLFGIPVTPVITDPPTLPSLIPVTPLLRHKWPHQNRINHGAPAEGDGHHLFVFTLLPLMTAERRGWTVRMRWVGLEMSFVKLSYWYFIFTVVLSPCLIERVVKFCFHSDLSVRVRIDKRQS